MSNKGSIIGGQMQFKSVCSLKSHMDAVRGLQFMPDSMTMVSASEDCSVKIWDLSVLSDPKHTGSLQELEPYLSLRGHTGPIMSIGAATQSNNSKESEVSSLLYSGGINGSIHLWKVPPSHQIKPYGPANDSQFRIAAWEQAHED